MLRGLLAMLAATGLVVGSASLTLAQDESSDERSAMEQLEQAAEDGQQAVEAESEEEAKNLVRPSTLRTIQKVIRFAQELPEISGLTIQEAR